MPTFHFRQKHYTTEYQGERELQFKEIGVQPTSWLAGLLEFKSAATKLRREQRAELDDTLSVLRLAKDNSEWMEIANVDDANLDLDLVISALRVFRDTCSRLPISASAKDSATERIRKWVKDYGMARQIPKIARIHLYVKNPGRKPPAHGGKAKMVSDVLYENHELPIGATVQAGSKELKNKIGQRIQATLERVRATCVNELDQVEKQRADLRKEMALHLDANLTETLYKFSVNKTPGRLSRLGPAILDAQPMACIASYHEMMVLSAAKIAGTPKKTAAPIEFTASRGRELTTLLSERFGLTLAGQMNFQAAIFDTLFGGFNTAVACLLFIQTYTGWNVGSILELESRSIRKTNAGYEVQGYKTKTGDYTPIWFVDRNEHQAIRVLDHLLARLEELKKLGWVPKNEANLWIRAAGPTEKPKKWVSWDKALKKFLKKHGMQSFHFSMVRNEVLVGVANSKGGIEAARHVGGHTSIATTGHYADQMLMHRRNSSISLQFQLELQSSVKYTFANNPVPVKEGSELLYSVGDGTSCVDPTNPPFKLSVGEEICDTTKCHLGEGCSNNRIIINAQRIEELIRHRRYLESTWQKRLNEYPDRFENIDLPSWAFSEALCGVIAKGPYRHHLKKLEASIKEENN